MPEPAPDYLLLHEISSEDLQAKVNDVLRVEPGYLLLGAPFAFPKPNGNRGVAQALIKGSARSSDRSPGG